MDWDCNLLKLGAGPIMAQLGQFANMEVCVSKCANSDGFFLHSYYSLGPAGHPSVDSLVGHSLDESCVQRFWPAMW